MPTNEQRAQRILNFATMTGGKPNIDSLKGIAAAYKQNPQTYDKVFDALDFMQNTYGKNVLRFDAPALERAVNQYKYYQSRVERGYDPIQIPSLDWNPTQYDDVTNEALAGWYKSNKSLPSAYQASEFSNYLAQYKQEREAAEIKDMYRLAGYDKAGTTRLKFNDAWKEYGLDYDLTDADDIRRKQIGVPPKAFLNLYTTDGDFADEDTRRFEAGELPVALDPVFQRPTPMPRATHGVSFDPRGVQQAQASAAFTGGQGVQQPAQPVQPVQTAQTAQELQQQARAAIPELQRQESQSQQALLDRIQWGQAEAQRQAAARAQAMGMEAPAVQPPTAEPPAVSSASTDRTRDVEALRLIADAPVTPANVGKGAVHERNKYASHWAKGQTPDAVVAASALDSNAVVDPHDVAVTMITPAEAELIAAYYGAGNYKAGDKAFAYFREIHAREYSEQSAADFAENASGVQKVGAAIGSFAPAVAHAGEVTANAIGSMFTGDTTPARESAATLAMRRAGAGEASLLENTRGVGRWAAQVGLGTAKMLPMLATGVAAPALMGASAGGQAALDAKDSGATAGQQFFQGLAQGVAEGLFEKWSLGALKAFKPVKAAGVKGALRELAKLGFVNATEEVFTDVSNMLTDAVIMEAFGDGKSESEIRQLYEARINNGEPVDAARWGVVGDIATKLLNTAAVGAGMGVLLGGGKVLGEAASNIGTRAEQGAAAQEPPAPRQSVTDAPQAIAGQGRADTPAQQQNAVQGQETANTQYAQQDAQRQEVAQMRSQAEAVIETLPAEQQDTAREVLTQWQNENNAARANPNVVMLESRDSIDTVTDSRMQSAERLGKALGVNVQWAESISRPNGQTAEALYDAATGTITIAVEADAPYHHLFGHEFTHHLEQSDGYDAMRGFVVQQLQQRGDYDAAIQVLSDTYQTNDTAVLERELVADYAKNVLFADEATVRYFVRSQSGLGGRILNWITDTLAKLGGQNSEAAAQLRRARDLWAAAMQGERGANVDATQGLAQAEQGIPAPTNEQQPQAQSDRRVSFSESGALGNSGVAYTNNNQAIQFDYAVVPVSDLITSHDENGNANPAYPQELQPRQRDRTASLAQIRSIAATLNPERLGADSSVQNGAPIVGNDGVVESGNGRTAAIALAYRNGGERAQRYAQYIRDNAARFGIDPQSIPRNPVLVRMRTSDINRATFGDVANQSTTAAFSPLETAVKDATALTPDTMSLFVPNDSGRINTRDNQPFIQRFFRNAVNSSEIGEYVTANGELSQAGLMRIRNAIFQKAYDNVALGERLSELLDDNSKTLTNALVNAAPVMVDLNIGIEGGHYYPLNIVDDVTAAAAKFVSLREQNVPIDEYLSQLGFMPDLSPEARALLTVINDGVKRRSYKRISGYLAMAADAVKALGDPRQASFIDNSTVTKGDILSAAAQRYETETGRPVSLSELEPRTGEVGAETVGGVLRQAETGEAVEAGQVGLAEGSQYSLRSDPLDAMLAGYGVKTKTSQFRTNTIERSTEIDDATKDFMDAIVDFEYTPESAEEWRTAAESRIVADPDGVMRGIQQATSLSGGQQTFEAALLAKQMYEEAVRTNDPLAYRRFATFTQEIAAKTREAARALKATDLSWSKRTPEGMVMAAQHVMDKAEQDAPTATKARVAREAGDVKDAIGRAAQDAAQQVENEIVNPRRREQRAGDAARTPESPAERLARMIEGTTKAKTPQETDFIKLMVGELFGVAKESPLPKAQADRASALSRVSDAYQKRQQYVETWKAAKEILRDRFADNPEVLGALDAYFDKGIKPPYASKSFTAAFNEGLKALDLNMGDVMKAYYASGTANKYRLIKYLVSTAGLTGNEARSFANAIDSQFHQLRKEQADKYLAALFDPKKAHAPTDVMQKIEALSNAGGLANENYIDKAMARVTQQVKQLMRQKGVSIADLVKRGYKATELERARFLKETSEQLQINERDLKTVLDIAVEEFDKQVSVERARTEPRLFKEGTAALGHSLDALARSNKGTRADAIRALVDYLVEHTDATGEQAEALAARTEARYKALLKQKAVSILKRKYSAEATANPKTRKKKTLWDGVIELVDMGAYEDADLRNMVKERNGLPVLSAETAKKISRFMRMAEAASRRRDFRQAHEYEVLAKTELANQLPQPKDAKLIAWRYFSMLANPKTHLRNIIGNAVMYTMRGAKDTVAWGMERFIPAEERTKALLNLFSPETKSLRQAATGDFWRNIDSIQAGSRFGTEADIRQYQQIFKGKFEQVREWTMNLLEKEDLWFIIPNYVDALTQGMAARGITAADLEANTAEAVKLRQHAALEAQKATFREANALATALNRMEKSGKIAEVVLSGAIPFKRTPMNIVKRSVEYSPLGLVKGTSELLTKLRGGEMSTAQVIDSFAAGLTGTAIMALGAWLAASGVLFGADDDDREDRYKSDVGHQGYSIRAGDKSYTVDWVAPFAMPLFAGVNLYELAKADSKPGGALDSAYAALMAIADPIMGLSMLQGINAGLTAYGSGSSGGALGAVVEAAIASLVGQMFPTVGGQIARTIDPVRRTTYVQGGRTFAGNLENLTRRVMNKVPGLSFLNEPYVDVWGRQDVDVSSAPGRAVANLFSPGYVSAINETEVDKEIQRLYDATKNTSVLPAAAPGSQTISGETYYLLPDELTEWREVQGQLSYAVASDAMASAQYSKMDSEARAKALSNIYGYAREVARMRFMVERGLDYEPQNVIADVKAGLDAGLDEATVILFRTEVGTYSADKDANGKAISGSKKAKAQKLINSIASKPAQRAALLEIAGYTVNDTTTSTSSAPRRVGFGDTQEDKPVRGKIQ